MNILLIGSGGREHVLAWKLIQSPKVEKLYCAPGNGGIMDIAECVDIPIDDLEGLVDFAKQKNIDLTVVGPEAPLVEGIVDLFEHEGLTIFGPTAQAAQLEGSKVFAKEFMHDCNIPTALFKSFTDETEAREFLDQTQFPLVIKADGLASGKGVFICEDKAKALKAIDKIMADRIFEEAGNAIVIEEFLKGEEASILAVSDGDNYIILDSSQDHKQIFDDDLGPNTGGMGAYSPAPVVTDDILKKIDARVIEPTIRGMKRQGIVFKGILYAGIMITENGPLVLEFNVRFGDPETQVVLARLKTDLVDVMLASCHGTLNRLQLEWDPQPAVCVVMSAGGYPGKYEKNKEIAGIHDAEKQDGVFVFHAGTKVEGGKLLTSGGRVLGVTALGNSIENAIQKAYTAVDCIKFDSCFFRRDIGAKALARMIRIRR